MNELPSDVRSSLDLILDGVDHQTKLKVYQLLQKTQVEPDDPMFLALLALTHAQVTIAPIPDKLGALVEEMKSHLVTLQSLSRGQIQECREVATDINVTANRLSRQLVRHSSNGMSPAFSLLWAFFGAVTGGVLIFVLQRFL